MHRNTYINSTELLDETYNLKSNSNIYFAGQITGVEGYVESISSGMVAGLNAVLQFKALEKYKKNPQFSQNTINAQNIQNIQNVQEEHIMNENKHNSNEKSNESKVYINNHKAEGDKLVFSENTVIGALAKYISTPNNRFQPMNANFGILPDLQGKKIKDKKERYRKLAERSLGSLI